MFSTLRLGMFLFKTESKWHLTGCQIRRGLISTQAIKVPEVFFSSSDLDGNESTQIFSTRGHANTSNKMLLMTITATTWGAQFRYCSTLQLKIIGTTNSTISYSTHRAMFISKTKVAL